MRFVDLSNDVFFGQEYASRAVHAGDVRVRYSSAERLRVYYRFTFDRHLSNHTATNTTNTTNSNRAQHHDTADVPDCIGRPDCYF
jgi:hypothetical protein